MDGRPRRSVKRPRNNSLFEEVNRILKEEEERKKRKIKESFIANARKFAYNRYINYHTSRRKTDKPLLSEENLFGDKLPRLYINLSGTPYKNSFDKDKVTLSQFVSKLKLLNVSEQKSVNIKKK